MKDIVHQHFFCEWERVNLCLERNHQSSFTPLNEILKGCAYRHVENLKNRVDEIHIQRLEYISKEEDLKILDPISNLNEIPSDLVCCVTKIPSTVSVKKLKLKNRKICGEEIYFFLNIHTCKNEGI
jgi:hypothetical protein